MHTCNTRDTRLISNANVLNSDQNGHCRSHPVMKTLLLAYYLNCMHACRRLPALNLSTFNNHDDVNGGMDAAFCTVSSGANIQKTAPSTVYMCTVRRVTIEFSACALCSARPAPTMPIILPGGKCSIEGDVVNLFTCHEQALRKSSSVACNMPLKYHYSA